MYREISIARVDGSDALTPMLANAATPYRYKSIFGEDLIKKIASSSTINSDGTGTVTVNFVGELAFVMAMQAAAHSDKNIKMDKLNEEKFVEWLEQYDSLSMENASNDIFEVYAGNIRSDSEAKKNKEEQSAS